MPFSQYIIQNVSPLPLINLKTRADHAGEIFSIILNSISILSFHNIASYRITRTIHEESADRVTIRHSPHGYG